MNFTENKMNVIKKYKKTKIIYPKYAFWIIIYAIIFFSIGVTIGKILDTYLPKYDKDKKESILLLEIYLQIGLIALSTYIFRENVDFILKNLFKIKKSPDKFAILIVAPTMFGQQKELMKKLNHLWNF
tara:strand:- start:983 stop:1366 length:384 start_codon:yes stop_codon:yes gene_type:complete